MKPDNFYILFKLDEKYFFFGFLLYISKRTIQRKTTLNWRRFFKSDKFFSVGVKAQVYFAARTYGSVKSYGPPRTPLSTATIVQAIVCNRT